MHQSVPETYLHYAALAFVKLNYNSNLKCHLDLRGLRKNAHLKQPNLADQIELKREETTICITHSTSTVIPLALPEMRTLAVQPTHLI